MKAEDVTPEFLAAYDAAVDKLVADLTAVVNVTPNGLAVMPALAHCMAVEIAIHAAGAPDPLAAVKAALELLTRQTLGYFKEEMERGTVSARTH